MQRGESMDVAQLVTIVLGGGLLGSLVTWWTSRHRPKVDTAQVVLTGSDNLINQLQEERDRLDERIDKVEKRAREVEKRAESAEARAKEAEETVGYTIAKVADLSDLHIRTVHGFRSGTVPPLPPIPPSLADVLDEGDFPSSWPTDWPVIIRHDTGTPGVDHDHPPE